MMAPMGLASVASLFHAAQGVRAVLCAAPQPARLTLAAGISDTQTAQVWVLQLLIGS